MSDNNKNSDYELDEESIPVLSDVIVPGEPLESVDIEKWEPESYQPSPMLIEHALDSDDYTALIENITDEVHKNITERIRESFGKILEETLENTMEQCEESIRNSILTNLRENLPEIITKSLNKAEENHD